MILRNNLGWENEFGEQLAFDEEHSFMNCCRASKHQRPIWKNQDDALDNKGESK